MLPTTAEQTAAVAEAEAAPAFAVAQDDIDFVLRIGDGMSRLRIFQHYQQGLTPKETVSFLKNEYGISGRTVDFPDGTRGHVDYNGKGIGISRNGIKIGAPDLLLTWPRAEHRIRQLIKGGRYLSGEEKSQLAQQRVAQGFAYKPGDLVYLADRRRYEIEDVDVLHVTLHDPDFPMLRKITTAPDFEAQLAGDERNFYLPPRAVAERPTPAPEVESPVPARDPAAPPYRVGDTVYLENVPFEITQLRDTSVQLRDPALPIPIFRAESRENFERLLLRDTRNCPITEFLAADLEQNDTDLEEVLLSGLLDHRDKEKISGWLRSGEGNTRIAQRLSEAYAGQADSMVLITGETADYFTSTVSVEVEIHDKYHSKYAARWAEIAPILRAFYQQEMDGFSQIPTPREPVELAGAPAYQVGDPVVLEHGDRALSGTVGYVGETDVRIDGTGPYSWDNQVVNRAQFEDGIRHDERNANLFPAEHQPPDQNFRITDDDLGAGGPKTKFAANVAAIETLKRVEAEGRPATPEEQDTLSRYVGWGGIQEAFDERKENWRKEYQRLKALLTPDEYKSAMASVLNAHFTSPTVIKAIYQCVENMGFQTGNILEPALGVGNFFGLLPESMAGSKLHGAELDPITGRIAQTLYPQARIQVKGFEKTNWPDNFFDLAVGNVPFGSYHVSDPKYDKLGLHIHDYFFIKTIDQVRPGGVVAFVTSHYTLDKKNSAVRRLMAQRCELVGAIRLPNNAFRANAGTDVTADILFLQKRDRPITVEPDWTQVGQTAGGLTVNQYFIDHPEMVMGTLTNDNNHRMYGDSNDVSCEPFPDRDLSELLAGAIQSIHTDQPLFVPDIETALNEGTEIGSSGTLAADPEVHNFSYGLVDGTLYYRENSEMVPAETSKTGESRVRGMIVLRDTVRKLIDAQMGGCDDATLYALQQRLNTVYDRYTAEYGLINSRANSMAFSGDSSYPLLCALEELDDEGKLLRKADMFTKRTIRQWSAITHVDTAVEALGVSIGTLAKVDLAYMAELMGPDTDVDSIVQELQGVIFRDPKAEAAPQSGETPLDGWQTADEYLSGDVRKKLEIARYYSEKEPGRYDSNVEALTAVQPKDLEAMEIGVKLGTTWIPAEDVQNFVYALLDTPARYRSDIRVVYAKPTNAWYISGKNAERGGNVRACVTYGTNRVNAYEIIQDSLNLKDVRIFDTKYVDGKETRVFNGKETTLAQEKQTAIRAAFQDWIWTDPERRQRLTRYYNDTFNCTRPRQYDGSHIQFVGMNAEKKLMKHQIDAVARVLYGGNTLLAHVVGAGKTWEMVAAAMESKRLGLCQKSLIVVPGHLTEQWGADFLQLYPAANILVATRKDFEKQNRKKFCARIATGDYDAVIIGHSQFEKIPVSQERQQAQLERQIDEIRRGIAEAKAEKGENFTIKQMMYTQKMLEEKMKKLLATTRKDDTVTFEELGVDRLFIDEADTFKNLFLYTKMRNVAGISQTEAQKSSDLYMKCLYMDDLTAQRPGGPGRGVIFGTGTPVSNSMTELFTMMRYLQNSMLEQKGLSAFDSWASTFGETVTAIELKPEGGGYRAKTRFAKFFNLPELMNLWREVTDIQTAEMLKLPVPIANYHTEVTKPTELQQDMVQELGKRAEAVRGGSVDPSVDNMLKITSDGRKLALDQRLINQGYPDNPGSKVNACVENVFRIWRETTDNQGAQLVFSDLATPKGTVELVEQEDGRFTRGNQPYCVYYDIRDKLIDQGVPMSEIAFVHDYNSDAQKAALFAKVRSGRVRILLGSTAKMGAGTNVQKRLKALHDLDVPWRPRDLEQRSGRIVRRGNDYKEVDIFRYVTEGTFDSYSYQLIELKQKFISQIMSGKSPARTCEDVDDAALSYAEIKALCAGDPKIKLKMDLDVAVARLNTLRQGYLNEHYQLEDALLKGYPEKIARLEGEVATYQADAAIATAHPPANGEDFTMVVDGQTYPKKELAGAALIALSKTVEHDKPVEAGSFRGFQLNIKMRTNLFGNGDNLYVMELVGQKMRYEVELGSDPQGNIARLNNTLEGIGADLAQSKECLDSVRAQIEPAKAELLKPWPLEQEWKEKTEQLAKVNAELNADGHEPEAADTTPEEPTTPRLPKPRDRGQER